MDMVFGSKSYLKLLIKFMGNLTRPLRLILQRAPVLIPEMKVLFTNLWPQHSGKDMSVPIHETTKRQLIENIHGSLDKINKTLNPEPTKRLISFLKEDSSRQQQHNELFLPSMEWGWNFQQASVYVPGSFGVSSQMLHYNHARHNTYDNL